MILSSDCGQLVRSAGFTVPCPAPCFSYQSGCLPCLSSADGHPLRSEGLCCVSPGTTHANTHMNMMCHGPRQELRRTWPHADPAALTAVWLRRQGLELRLQSTAGMRDMGTYIPPLNVRGKATRSGETTPLRLNFSELMNSTPLRKTKTARKGSPTDILRETREPMGCVGPQGDRKLKPGRNR